MSKCREVVNREQYLVSTSLDIQRDLYMTSLQSQKSGMCFGE